MMVQGLRVAPSQDGAAFKFLPTSRLVGESPLATRNHRVTVTMAGAGGILPDPPLT